MADTSHNHHQRLFRLGLLLTTQNLSPDFQPLRERLNFTSGDPEKWLLGVAADASCKVPSVHGGVFSFPKCPCTQIVYTLAPMYVYLHRDYVKANVCTIWDMDPLGFTPSHFFIHGLWPSENGN